MNSIVADEEFALDPPRKMLPAKWLNFPTVNACCQSEIFLVPSGNEEASNDYDPGKNGHSSTLSPRPRVLPLAEEVGG